MLITFLYIEVNRYYFCYKIEILKSKMQQNKASLTTTMINFHETIEMMKSYLSKKRFSYVYEETIKYYNKNQNLLANHQILMLAELVFYVLKKKMITKNSPDLKHFSVESVAEIYNVMTNVYLSWENILSSQMNAENPQFFQMLFRTNKFKKKNHISKPLSLIFQSKKDHIHIGKINIEHKLYNFFKQTLRMVINSLISMNFQFNQNKIQKMCLMINKCQNLMKQFTQHMFPVQKVEFYLIKCQILELTIQNTETCLKFNLKYQFPVGLFQLIYKNLMTWKQPKIMHYVKLLVRLVVFTTRNQLIQVKDAFILANQIKILIFCLKKSDGQYDRRQRRNSIIGGRKGILDIKSSLGGLGSNNQIKRTFSLQRNNQNTKINQSPKTNQKKHPSSNNNQKKYNPTNKHPQKKQSNLQQTKSKSKFLSILRTILSDIEDYIQTRRQLTILAKVYLEDIYNTYKQNQNDQINDEIPMLIETDNRKSKFDSTSKKQQRPFLKLNFKQKQSISSSKKQNHHDDQHNYQSIGQHFSSETRRKDNTIILQNILNIKHKKKLTLASHGKQVQNLTNKKSQNIKNVSLASTQGSTKDIYDKNTSKNNFNFHIFFKTISEKGSKQISVFKDINQSDSSPIRFLNQSSSDQQNEMEYEFEKKRRQQINEINSRYYKKSNPNYILNDSSLQDSQADNIGESQKSDSVLKSHDSFLETNNKQEQLRFNQKFQKKIKKVSDQIQFDQIKLLDQVIHDKIFKYLKLQLDGLSSVKKENQSSGQRDNTEKSNIGQRNMIIQYKKVIKNTQNLKKQVEQLNRQRALLVDNFSYKNDLIRLRQKYNQKEEPSQIFHSGILRDLQNLYNTKNNLTQKALKCVNLYRKLLRMDKSQQKQNYFRQTVKRYGSIYRTYEQKLSMIEQAQQSMQNTTNRRQQQLPIVQYIVQNRPISLLQKTLKMKQQTHKFNHHGHCDDMHLQVNHKQIALRQTFDNLRGDISKSKFSQSNSLTKNFTSKIKNQS